MFVFYVWKVFYIKFLVVKICEFFLRIFFMKSNDKNEVIDSGFKVKRLVIDLFFKMYLCLVIKLYVMELRISNLILLIM